MISFMRLIDNELVCVDMLYRLHALEKLAVETDEDNYPTGLMCWI